MGYENHVYGHWWSDYGESEGKLERPATLSCYKAMVSYEFFGGGAILGFELRALCLPSRHS
jgi:hypothetical protein